MKSNSRASRSDKNSSIVAKINDFVSLNSFALLLLILGIWYHQVFVVGETVNKLETNQNKMVYFLKKNIDKVYFLSPSGMVISAKKGKISYTDERFKSYMLNEITDKLIAGNIVLSSNYTLTFGSPSEIITKNADMKSFYERFVSPNQAVLMPSMRSMHRAVVEGRYPEYINIISQRYIQYRVTKPSERTGYQTLIEADVDLTLLVKSWIRDLKKWDTREISIKLPFSAVVNISKYANMGNPFGVHFTKLAIPAIHKPTGSQIRDEKK